MIKKTLLSIMTIAALANSATAAVGANLEADAVTKEILVIASIERFKHAISVTWPSDNTTLLGGGYDHSSMLFLKRDTNDTQRYKAVVENIKLNYNGGNKLNVNLLSPFELKHSDNELSNLSDIKVTLGGKELSTTAVGVSTGSTSLEIDARAPTDAVEGDEFKGRLRLNFEAPT